MSPELLVAGSIGAVAFLAGLLLLRRRAGRTRGVSWHAGAGAPQNPRYTCGGCKGEFTHTRRTMAAWRKGTRHPLCPACHTKLQAQQAATRTGGTHVETLVQREAGRGRKGRRKP